MQYCSKEDEDCSLQYSHFIRELVQLKIPLENGYWFKSHCIYITYRFSRLWGCLQSRRKIRKWYFHYLTMLFCLHQKILYWKVTQFFIHGNKMIYVIIILDFLFKVVWCLMTSSWIWSGKRQWNAKVRVLIVILQISRTTQIICTGGSLQDIFWKKGTRESPYQIRWHSTPFMNSASRQSRVRGKNGVWDGGTRTR